MDDVIFAGTSDRPALGRAEVSLTIDNSSGMLPIEFSEVTITRCCSAPVSRSTSSTACPCRLLDIQEMLSDTGIGRQQHVIVGQGQLDQVLNSRPEDRRAIIEEAAGILKYRRRKEKAERRLEATEGSLLRLNDLLREVRRGLAPLQRQADAARRHGGLVDRLLRSASTSRARAGWPAGPARGASGARRAASAPATGDPGPPRELDVWVMERSRPSPVWRRRAQRCRWSAGSLRERTRRLAALVAENSAGSSVSSRPRRMKASSRRSSPSRGGSHRARGRWSMRRPSSRPTRGREAAEAELGGNAALARRGTRPRPCRAVEDARRTADAEVHRWDARAEAPARSRSTRPGAVRRGPGGSTVWTGHRTARRPPRDRARREGGVAAALGEAMRAVVVERGPAADAALARLKGGDLDAWSSSPTRRSLCRASSPRRIAATRELRAGPPSRHRGRARQARRRGPRRHPVGHRARTGGSHGPRSWSSTPGRR